MRVLQQFQELDDLIIEHTKPPVTPMLRSRLATMREELEAYQASSDKQDESLATQLKTVEQAMKAKEDAEAKLAEFQRQHFSKEAQARAWREKVRRANAIYNPENMYKEP